MSTASVRYLVDDVDAAVDSYTRLLGFEQQARPGPGFAIVVRVARRLLLSAPAGPGGAAQAMPDGRRPEPGGWNRSQLGVTDLDGLVEGLRGAGASFRNDIVEACGGRQVLLDDPAGNPVELFEPR
ncbi:VOC family protein [Qaidamihabitans albus]|uniref:VOC family protein n=1 Tax=Qaidamihabitans albus TaxID=2795733 RepID=UPI0018F17CB4|nr:VOC family protein [Qaidamihabitans albus]